MKAETKLKLSWILLLWTVYLILLINTIKNLKYFPHLIREFKKIIKKNSQYIEDNDFILIHKSKGKKF